MFRACAAGRNCALSMVRTTTYLAEVNSSRLSKIFGDQARVGALRESTGFGGGIPYDEEIVMTDPAFCGRSPNRRAASY